MHERTFYRWNMKHKQTLTATAPLTLVSAAVGAASGTGTLRLVGPGGWTVEMPIANATWLTGLLRELS